jgi:hypothetical protein
MIRKLIAATAVVVGMTLAASAVAASPASAATGGGCGSIVNFYGSSGHMTLKSCISFDALANFGFGGYVGDGYVGGAVTQPCQFHEWYVTSSGTTGSTWDSCYTGHLTATEDDRFDTWAYYTICLVFSGVQQGCATSPKSFR